MFDRGFVTVARAFGAPIRIHWTTPLGLLLTGFFVWPIALGTGILIILHELGHAVVASRMGVRVLRLDVLPWGGQCAWVGNPRPIERAMIAWGGVLAQLLVLVLTIGALRHFGMPGAGVLDGLAVAFTLINGMLIFTNLVPVEPLDGAEAWPLLKMAWRNWQRARLADLRIEATRINRLKDRALAPAEIPPQIQVAMRKALEEARRH
jgi:Zn-dependent protease